MSQARARIAVVAALLIAPACTIGSMTADATPVSVASVADSAVTGPAQSGPVGTPLPSNEDPTDPNVPDVAVDLASSFADLEAQLGSNIGVAIVPVGGGAAQTFGSDAVQVAWSTIKVPLAIAALEAGTATDGTVSAAIANSDNASAQSLWDGLGGGEEAAAAVEAVLARGGDASTDVQPTVIRSGFTAFGQTQWPLPAQATFTANLRCDLGDSAATVLSYMSNVSGTQQWGVQPYGAPVKGGWGPLTDGSYLVRQLGIMTNATGSFAVALTTSGGSFESGAEVLTQVGAWINENKESFTGGSC